MIQRNPARFADADEARRKLHRPSICGGCRPTIYANPYPTYHALREHAPVHRLPDGGYFLSRYADCVAVYKDTPPTPPTRSASSRPSTATACSSSTTPPASSSTTRRCTRACAASSPAPSRRAPSPTWSARWWRWSTACSMPWRARARADLIADLAAAVPVEVIGNLLAVPREERGPLRDWSLAILGALEPVLTPEQRARGEQAVADFLDYLRRLVADRRAHPGDPERDVLTRLIQGEARRRSASPSASCCTTSSSSSMPATRPPPT